MTVWDRQHIDPKIFLITFKKANIYPKFKKEDDNPRQFDSASTIDL